MLTLPQFLIAMSPYPIPGLNKEVAPGIMVMDIVAAVLSTPVQAVAGSKFVADAYKVRT